MYFIPQNFQTSNLPEKTLISILLNTLTIPPQQRKLSDHEFVFQFFHQNKKLSDVERLKSLNARQQCIANLCITTKKPEPNSEGNQPEAIIIDEIVVVQQNEEKQADKKGRKKGKQKEKPLQTKYYVILATVKHDQIMKVDEKHLRRNIEKLKNYMILKDLKYAQMLHLAYYMDQISYKYKQEVYKEGDDPEYLYLIEKGEFNYSKTLQEPQFLPPSLQKQKKSRPKRYDAHKADNPNRLKNSKSIEMTIGIIQGATGQSFGVEQIISEVQIKREGEGDSKRVKREYTVRCMSTQNSVIRIPEQNYKRVINGGSFTKMQWVKRENQKKLQLKDEMLSKMIEVKHNYKKYAEIISNTNLSKTQQIRLEKQHENNRNSVANDITNNNINRSMLPRIKSQSMASEQHRIPPHLHQFLDRSRGKTKAEDDNQRYQQRQRSPKILKSQQSEENEDEATFALTKAEIRKKKMQNSNQKQKQTLSLHVNTNGSNASLLPTIVSEKSKVINPVYEHSDGANKNWSNYKPLLELRGLRNKFSGMIDAGSLVKQKQQILNLKLNGKQATKQIFSLQVAQKTHPNRSLLSSSITPSVLTKQQARQLRSAVHSKVFMQKLLVQALKKAGYNSEKKQTQSYYVDDSPNSIVDIKNNLRVPKSKIKLERERQKNGKLLQDNEFDQCYFRKM